jgi:hypothetical protein
MEEEEEERIQEESNWEIGSTVVEVVAKNHSVIAKKKVPRYRKVSEHPLNQSKSKQKWSFSKSDRFKILPLKNEQV